MRLMFVYHIMEILAGDAGSARDIHTYLRVAKSLGHEIVIYGPSDVPSSFTFSMDVGSADAVIFIFEWTTHLRYGFSDHLDLARLVSSVPRERRIVIDCDGNYNDPISIGGDYNHRDGMASQRWIEACDSLSDKICQPTLHPVRSNVRPFLFYAYNPRWEIPLDVSAKDYGMIYVGHGKFRWLAMHRVLQAMEPIRAQVGRIGIIGHGWDGLPPWAARMQMEDAYRTDPAYLSKLGTEVMPPIRFDQVIHWMSKAMFNPVLLRPTFDQLRLVTPRMFETLAASTLPLFELDAGYVKEIYGERALELVLPKNEPEEKILDMMRRPEHYANVVNDIREYLTKEHSHAARLRELIEIVES